MNKALLSGIAGLLAGASFGAPHPVGKCMWGLGEAADLKAAGYDFCENAVSAFLIPDQDDQAWAAQKAKILEQNAILRTISCNGFLPGTFRLTGTNVTHEAALEYAVRACRRADEVGLEFIVFGSGSARKIPEGFDRQEGRRQFIEFCRKLAERIKDCRVTIVLEPLNARETNLLNFVGEGVEIVDEVDSPRVQLLADVYHMCQVGEKAAALVKAGKRLRHVHLADPATRQYPGYSDADLTAYLQALDAIGYTGGVSIESGWAAPDYAQARKTALTTVRRWME